MRPIKFRAWDKNDNRWLHNIHIDLDGELFVASKGGYSQVYWDKEDWIQSTELMQFTGLHDKNGKEIWEGDIVKISDIDFKDKIVSVIYLNGAFRDSYIHWILDAKPFNYEVIGNIYENPELLK